MHPGHLLTGLGPVRAALLLTGQPPPGFGHRDRRGNRTLRKRSRPHDVQRRAHLRRCQLPVAVLETRPGVLRRRLGLLAGLEPRVAGALVEEVPKRRLQVAKPLLGGTEETSFKNARSGSFFHSVSAAEAWL